MNVAGLIRFGGHLPKGGYDVPHGGRARSRSDRDGLARVGQIARPRHDRNLQEDLMSRSNEEEKDQIQLGRRKFLRIGGLGAAALAAGAAGRAEVAPETGMPGQAGQAPPAQAPPAQVQPAQRPPACLTVPSEFRSGAGVRAVDELRRVHGHACRSADSFAQLGLCAASRPPGRRHHGQHAALRVRRPSGRRRVQQPRRSSTASGCPTI